MSLDFELKEMILVAEERDETKKYKISGNFDWARHSKLPIGYLRQLCQRNNPILKQESTIFKLLK